MIELPIIVLTDFPTWMINWVNPWYSSCTYVSSLKLVNLYLLLDWLWRRYYSNRRLINNMVYFLCDSATNICKYIKVCSCKHFCYNSSCCQKCIWILYDNLAWCQKGIKKISGHPLTINNLPVRNWRAYLVLLLTR